MALILTITTAGRAALRNADGSGTRAVRLAAVGFSATPLAPTAATTALPGEIKRITTLSGEAVAADIIHLVVRDETMATYTVRSFALYLDDGTPFAFYGQGDPIIEKSAQALLLLAIDVTLADITASQITFGDANFTMPPATDIRAGVIELATIAEAKAGTDTTRAVTPATAKASVLDWIGYTPVNAVSYNGYEILTKLMSNDGAGSGLDADLLDGREGAWYADIPARLGFVPLATSAYTAGDIRAKLLTVDGAGSGVDADLLDGQHGSWYADIVARLGYTPVNTVSYNGYEVLLKVMGNDGAGSGLDADLLDGQQGSWYADIVARLGYTPVNAVSYNGYEVLLKVMGNDGAGSGLDADLLDGREGDWYADIAARLGFAPLAASSYTATDVRAKLFTVDGAGSGLDADLLDGREGDWYADIPARLGFTPVNATAFNGYEILAKLMSNDGAGSGLDADLLDGRHADSFANTAHTHTAADLAGAFAGSLAENGYTVLPNGLILQWVTGPMQGAGTEGTAYIQWPIAFPTACFQAFPSTQIPSGTDRGDTWFQLVGNPDQNGVTVQRQRSSNAADAVASAPKIFALGH